MKKTCTACNRSLEPSKFTRRSNPWQCSDCINKYMHSYHTRTEKRDHDKRKSWRRNSKIRSYGISIEDHAALAKSQRGRCAICRKKPEGSLAVDHDHKTGRVRGLLCHLCNKGIGCLGDSVKFVQAAVGYLKGDKG